MKDKRGREEKRRKKVNRRDFAKKSVAAGAAAVAFPTLLRAGSDAGVMAPIVEKKAAAGGEGGPKTHHGEWREGTTTPAEYYLEPEH